MDRRLIAYLLIALLALAAAALVAFRLYHSRGRTLRRGQRDARDEYQRRLSDREDPTLP